MAAPGVTVIDDGTIADRRGSLSIDDEGNPTTRNVLIEDGILRGYLQDRMNARLMGVAPTGNGRRESYASIPMPRMTNTFMLGGDKDPARSSPRSIAGSRGQLRGRGRYHHRQVRVLGFGAYGREGQDPLSVQARPSSATADALTHVSLVGNDMCLDPGVGMCGKDGQSVPVGVGQPTIRIEGLTVGGTA